MKIQSGACTHVGRRENNEDCYCDEPALGLFAVADGMGGYEGGEVASRVAIDTLRGFFDRDARDEDTTWPFALERARSLAENRVNVGVKLADAEVRARKTGRLASMGTTLAALALDARGVVVGHVGDSRVYRLRAARLEPLTRDHSLYAEMVAAGIDVGPRERFGMINVVTRALGGPGGGRPDVRAEPVLPGDVFLLCSDGLTEPLSEARIAQLLAREPPQRACEALVHEAFELGGRDNITAVVVRVG